MNTVEVCQLVCREGIHLARPKPGVPGEYDAKPWPGGKKKGWFFVDAFSAAAVISVYNAVSEENKTKLEKLELVKAVKVCFKLLNNQSKK